MSRNLPHKPTVSDPTLQKWINHVHSFISKQVPTSISPPGNPSNLLVTPGPGQNHIRFTGGVNASGHIILASPSPVWNPTNAGNQAFDIGISTEFPHVVGQADKKMYYWVVAVRNGLSSHPPVGPVSSTTLALNIPLVSPLSTRQQPGNVTLSDQTDLPTIQVPGLTRGDRQP